MPAPGELIALDIEKPAAGGRMLARLDGQIVFVSGTIPGEHVTARVEFVRGGVVFARAESIDVWSPDRRADGADRICGGNDYAHIAYDRQLTLKRDLVEDAFSRIAKLALPPDVSLHPSPERGYRMRARLHVEGGQVGFYRQASHDLCDAMSSGQLHDGAATPLAGISRAMRDGKISTARVLDLSEDIPGTGRAVQIELDPEERESGRWDSVLSIEGVTGVAVSRRGRVLASRGELTVTDNLEVPGGALRVTRQVGAFFQGNRYLLQPLVDRLLVAIPPGPLGRLVRRLWTLRPRPCGRGARSCRSGRERSAQLRRSQGQHGAAGWHRQRARRGRRAVPRGIAGARWPDGVDRPAADGAVARGRRVAGRLEGLADRLSLLRRRDARPRRQEAGRWLVRARRARDLRFVSDDRARRDARGVPPMRCMRANSIDVPPVTRVVFERSSRR